MKCETFVFNQSLEDIRIWLISDRPGSGRVPAFEDWEPPIEDISLLLRRYWSNSNCISEKNHFL